MDSLSALTAKYSMCCPNGILAFHAFLVDVLLWLFSLCLLWLIFFLLCLFVCFFGVLGVFFYWWFEAFFADPFSLVLIIVLFGLIRSCKLVHVPPWSSSAFDFVKITMAACTVYFHTVFGEYLFALFACL